MSGSQPPEKLSLKFKKGALQAAAASAAGKSKAAASSSMAGNEAEFFEGMFSPGQVR
jgi:hypothetical protein